jgi:hypothetical protein
MGRSQQSQTGRYRKPCRKVLTVRESDYIGVTFGDRQRLALLFSVDSNPLRVTTARPAPPTEVPRPQHAVRCARPQEKLSLPAGTLALADFDRGGEPPP